MIVPSVGIVVCDHDRSRIPELGLLDSVDGRNDESLLVERIGISGVTILIAGRLEEYHRRHLGTLGSERLEEVVAVVLMISAGRICRADRDGRRRTGMRRIRRARIVLERLMMRYVIRLIGVGDARYVLARASISRRARAGGIRLGQIESTLEESPGDVFGIEQITDVLAGHREGLAAHR